jgi:hypothetical protein
MKFTVYQNGHITFGRHICAFARYALPNQSKQGCKCSSVLQVLKEQYGVQCMLGLTATATMVTAASVAQHLGIQNYQEATIRGTPIPRNLCLSVSRDEDKEEVFGDVT